METMHTESVGFDRDPNPPHWSVRERSLVLLTVLSLIAGIIIVSSRSGLSPQAEASPLDGSTWCSQKDSLALVASSSGTGYKTPGYTKTDGTYQATQHGWWARVTRQMSVSFPGFQSWNWSHSGASLHNFLPGGPYHAEVVNGLTANKPNLLLYMLGTNDFMGKQTTPAVYAQRLDTFITMVRTASPSTNILVLFPWEVRVGETFPYTWQEFAKVTFDTVAARRAALIDLRMDIPRMPAVGVGDSGMYDLDRIHGSAALHIAVSDVVRQALWC